jgi:hypothetical protein
MYSPLPLGYKPVQHVTVLNTVGSYNTTVSIIIILFPLALQPSAGYGLLTHEVS